MDLAQLRIFLAVIDHHGFRRAAAKLYLSQPAVSRQVAELERSLGVILFRRENGRAWLTPTGERFAERAQRILDDCADAVREARAEQLSGELRIGVSPGGAAELTGPILRHLIRALPEVKVRVIDVPILQWSEAPPPGLDLQLVRDPVRPAAARSTTLLDEPMILTASVTSEVSPTGVSLAEAGELPMARFDPTTPRRLLEFWSLSAARNATPADFRGEPATGPAMMAQSVAHGNGVAACSPSLCRAFAPSPLITAPIIDGPRVRSLATSRIGDDRPVIDAAHREIAGVVERLGPLVVPELHHSL